MDSWRLGGEKFRGGEGDKLVRWLQQILVGEGTSCSFVEAPPTLGMELLPLDRG